ncbi:hypothetical protein VTK73DRAFT_2458 [Phialemonium thermophilum]|uniref:Uncharacterized protein n=1 Tax=Phialemonium thermophilum TaxID=223376 RepID=A0ABR3VS34_9PEZI
MPWYSRQETGKILEATLDALLSNLFSMLFPVRVASEKACCMTAELSWNTGHRITRLQDSYRATSQGQSLPRQILPRGYRLIVRTK